MSPQPDLLSRRLAAAGFIAADEEAEELLAAAGEDAERLEAMLARRLTGEPLAWITGSIRFCGLTIRVDPGVYVPRWHTELIARQAIERLPEEGVAVDVCTGSGALARAMMASRPRARVVATDIDERAVACARANGVDALLGDLVEPLPPEFQGRVDVLTGAVPYVPHDELPLLQRDTFTFESALAYEGGDDGTDVLRRVIRAAPRWLREGGTLLLELGGDQAAMLRGDLTRYRFVDLRVLRDEEGDPRGIEARHAGAGRRRVSRRRSPAWPSGC